MIITSANVWSIKQDISTIASKHYNNVRLSVQPVANSATSAATMQQYFSVSGENPSRGEEPAHKTTLRAKQRMRATNAHGTVDFRLSVGLRALHANILILVV